LHSPDPKLNEPIMRAVQQIEARGIEQGMQQGIQIRSLEIARNMLHQLGLGIETVQQATGLSKEELAGL
jgi:predicted transposase/invertase (TIGR01784 family)